MVVYGLGGQNLYGQLGQGNLINYSSPVQVWSLTNWTKINYGNYHSIAIKTDRTLWSWGYNAQGKLGLDDSNSPVQVGSLTNWVQISGGFIYNSHKNRW